MLRVRHPSAYLGWGLPNLPFARQGAIRLESSLAELSVIPGVDPRRCLKGPLLPKGWDLD